MLIVSEVQKISTAMVNKMSNKKNRVLIIDGSNMFRRNFEANPAVSQTGPVGGLVGTMNSIQKVCNELDPDKVVMVWDGPGGSLRKRKIAPGYKQGRKPPRLNRFDRQQMTPEQHAESHLWQLGRLYEYIDKMPIHQIMIENVEADDVISYVAQMEDFEEWQKVIYSSDKDFYQLARGSLGDIDTLIYRPQTGGRAELVHQDMILEDSGIHPRNFAVARSIAGDKSDNLPGASNVGLGKIAKRFPYLAEEKEHSLKEIFEDCEKNLGKLKIYDSINDSKNLILTNYGMMQLDAPNIPYQSTKIIKDSIREMDMSFDKTSIEIMKRKDDIATARHENLYRYMKRFSVEGKK